MACDSKGGINTHVIVRDEFGLGALSSHAASQCRPSTIRGVSVVREGSIITAMNVVWMPAMGVTLFIV